MRKILATEKEFTVRALDGTPESDVCNPWKKTFLSRFRRDEWHVQATAPLMLEAIQDLLIAAFEGKKHPLLFSRKSPRRQDVVYVEKAWLNPIHFEELPGGINSVTKDVLGFLSIVLMNIKTAQVQEGLIWDERAKLGIPVAGPKVLGWIMPRNNWVSVFRLVQMRLPHRGSNLWNILEHLACYRNSKSGKLRLDERFCTGKVDNPKPNGELGKKSWARPGGYPYLLVKEWVDGFSNPVGGRDLLSEFDATRQIGGFDLVGKTMEHVRNSNRPVAIWEFRELGVVRPKKLLDHLTTIQKAVLEFHEKYPNEPAPERTTEEECRTRWWHIGSWCSKGRVQ
ncbi:hypothetical protein CTA2_4429 [Colletotrichum tanaceti]|uniref:Uncharacterized protein n=1 Tax=Colletotrichum tanaceti TaxID=1306861 RepID=A0A4U6XD05_9PEZI|nr:hypothetical protein CTA2_4430 [Colletotrichum tanaceti]KAJ0162520.1 hypothetical protein CTA2_4429 [Colletotrichum tanaceti]TKW53631.1 hypothetical protein CTA1_2395 [Colletotrichum tanaceti]